MAWLGLAGVHFALCDVEFDVDASPTWVEALAEYLCCSLSLREAPAVALEALCSSSSATGLADSLEDA